MKTKLAALLIATASVAHANLIDLTPGGFNVDNAPRSFTNSFSNGINTNSISLTAQRLMDGQVSMGYSTAEPISSLT